MLPLAKLVRLIRYAAGKFRQINAYNGQMRDACSVLDCTRPVVARTWCDTHYRRWARKGSPNAGRIAAVDRFMTHVDKRGPTDCWLWTGHLNHGGYGQFSTGKARYFGAHRWSYEHFVGPVPAGLDLDHLCRVRHCVNPDHLEPVTRRENLLRGTRNNYMASKTHCPQGHPYDEANTYRHRLAVGRSCRACSRLRTRERRAAERGSRGIA